MIFLFLSCAEPDKINGEPHPVDFEIPAAELEDIVNQNFDSGLPSMLTIGDIYEEMMSWGDENCPVFSPYVNGLEGHWVDDCVSSTGTHFLGFSQYFKVGNSLEDNGSQIGSIWGSFETIRANGLSVQIGGMTSIRINRNAENFTQVFQGTFWAQDADPWLETGSQNYMIDGSLTGKTILTGGIQYPEVVIYFDDLLYHPESCGNGLGIQGTILIRDRSGYWFTTERTGCTPCSDLFWGEENLGEFCVWESLDAAIKQSISEMEALMLE